MLRVAIWYESQLGRNDGNPLYVFAALKRMEEKKLLSVCHLRPTGDIKPFGSFDLNIWVDWGEDGLGGILPYECQWPTGAPVIYWASDTHLGYDYRLSCAKKSDLVFCAQKRGVDEFGRDGVRAIWLPHAFEPRAYSDPKDSSGMTPYNLLTKMHDVCFVGHVNSTNRLEALDRLFKEFPDFYYGQKLFNQAARKYCESKLSFNISMLDDLNMRTFEVMGSRATLLTNDIPTIHEFFEDGKHLILYRDLDEMVDKARFYLKDPDACARIAQTGYEEVMARHTIDHRVKVMLEEAKKLVKEEINV